MKMHLHEKIPNLNSNIKRIYANWLTSIPLETIPPKQKLFELLKFSIWGKILEQSLIEKVQFVFFIREIFTRFDKLCISYQPHTPTNWILKKQLNQLKVVQSKSDSSPKIN